jgi:hypothetical protein
MLFCQLGQAHSLMEITGGLATCMGKLRHLGIRLQRDLLFHMPTITDRGNCMRRYFIHSLINARLWLMGRRGSGLRTSYSVLMLQ